MAIITAVILFLTGIYFCLILYLLAGWIRKKEYSPGIRNFKSAVSIIIPVRNESANILLLLEDLRKQRFPKDLLEVIISDDESGDETIGLVKKFQQGTDLQIKIAENDKKNPGKKNAITNGIRNAMGALIITLDADCRLDKQWLSTIVSFYEEEQPAMIILPVCYNKGKTVFEKLQELEFISLMGVTGGSALNGMPLMCNGANLAYGKEEFFCAGGLSGSEQSPSGDDLFLMMKFRKKYPDRVRFLKSTLATAYTCGSPSLNEFINQRKRWVSKSGYYKDFWVIACAIIVFLFNSCILAMIILSPFTGVFAENIQVSLTAKLFIDFLFLFLTASFFKRKSLLWLYIPAQLFYLIYVPLITMAGFLGSFEWKGRKYE